MNASREASVETRPHYAHLACIWAGPLGLSMFFIGMLVCGMIPPKPIPGWTAEQVADFFANNHFRILLGQVVVLWGAALLLAFFAAVSVAMAQIEGKRPVLAITQIASWAVLTVFFFVPAGLWLAAAYRPRDPQTVLLLNDLSWFYLLVPLTPSVFGIVCMACVGFMDRSSTPVWPRWFCWYSIQAALILPLSLGIPFVKEGPFAWTGLLGFWLPLPDAGLWFIMCAVLMHRAWQRDARAPQAVGSE